MNSTRQDSADRAASSLFPQPAPFAFAPAQRLVQAGRFALFADPQDLDFAQRAAAACEAAQGVFAQPPAKGLSNFSRLAASMLFLDGPDAPAPSSTQTPRLSGFSRLAASMLFLDGPARSADWIPAMAMANSALDALGESAPLPASIPVEVHRPSSAWALREFFDLGSLHKLAYSISKKAGDPEGRIEQSFPETSLIASKLHAVGLMAGPSFISARHGPGTERVILGVANGGQVESAAELLGRHVAQALGPLAAPAVLGKAMILLHETFHLQQDWQACERSKSGRPMASSLLPDALASSNADFETEFAKHHAQGESEAAWVAELLHESYADALSAMAIAGFEAGAGSKACLATAAWRARVENPEDFSAKPMALARRAAQGSTLPSDDFDSHRTGPALLALRGALSELPPKAKLSGASATEAAKTASALGALLTIQNIVERPRDHSAHARSTSAACARLLLGASFPEPLAKRAGDIQAQAWREQALGTLEDTIEALRSKLQSDLQSNPEPAPAPHQTPKPPSPRKP